MTIRGNHIPVYTTYSDTIIPAQCRQGCCSTCSSTFDLFTPLNWSSQDAWQHTIGTYDRGTPEKVVPIAIKPTRSSRDSSSSRDSFDSSQPPSETEEDSHFNNLMFMLRTGGNMETESARTSPHSASERYELRRISIADTHL